MEAEKLNYKEREVFQLRRTDRVVLAHHLGARAIRISVSNDYIKDEEDADDNGESDNDDD